MSPQARLWQGSPQARRIRRRTFPVAVEFVGDELGEAGHRALSHFGARDAYVTVSSGVITAQMPTRPFATPAVSHARRPACASRGRTAPHGDGGGDEGAAAQTRFAMRCSWRAPTPCRSMTRRCGSPRGCAGRCRSDRCCVIASSMSASVGFGVCLQQRGGRHDLAGLAVAALRHVVLQPGRLHRMAERRPPTGPRWW